MSTLLARVVGPAGQVRLFERPDGTVIEVQEIARRPGGVCNVARLRRFDGPDVRPRMLTYAHGVQQEVAKIAVEDAAKAALATKARLRWRRNPRLTLAPAGVDPAPIPETKPRKLAPVTEGKAWRELRAKHAAMAVKDVQAVDVSA